MVIAKWVKEHKKKWISIIISPMKTIHLSTQFETLWNEKQFLTKFMNTAKPQDNYLLNHIQVETIAKSSQHFTVHFLKFTLLHLCF